MLVCVTLELLRLTPREHEVAILVSRGYSNRQIADELVVTPGTVANHVAHILGKLGYRRRIHGVIWALSGGLAEDSTAAQV